MPLKVKKVTIPTIVASVLFNGSNQYLSIANNAAFNFGTGDLTIEFWAYHTNLTGQQTYIGDTYGNTAGIYTYKTSNNEISLYDTAQRSLSATNVIKLNTWHHIVWTRQSGTLRAFVDGVLVASNIYAGSFTVTQYYIGDTAGTSSGPMNGYISNARIINGTALYTASFSVPTAPLTAIANTSILTCNAATIVDASSNNFAITNNNTATVSSTITPFIAASPGSMKFKKTSTSRIGRSVQFNGTSQYLSVGSVANWAFLNNGLTPFTIEAWVNPTSVSTTLGPMIASTTGYTAQIGFYFEIGNYNNGDVLFAVCNGSLINQWATSNNFLTANTWTHVAVSFTPNGTNVPSATVKFFVNGVLATSSNVYSRTTTYSTSNPTNTLLVGAYQTPVGGYFPGYISNLRIVNGTALYTSSFTVPTSPLTAIANTALLACNSATIVDNSSNNFAITNNNTATVSTTNPFGADTVSGTFKVIKPRGVFMTATGGDLITTSGSYKIHTFTTVGTSSFVVSSLGSTPVIECLLVGGGGGGGGRAMAGGGGGGGVVYTSSLLLATGSFFSIVGAGGIGATGMQASSGQNGGNASFTYNSITTTALGGGGGATEGYVGLNGGNGGGGTNGNGAGGSGTGGGFPGGSGSAENYLTRGCGGGGGGAGGAGVRGMQAVGGDGGIGAIYNITGSAYYGGGGGGGGNTNAGGATAGAGGLGGGGLGGRTSPGTAGTANTGGGGGGGGYDNATGGVATYGGNGGSGIILIKYRYTD